jgi:hypothetical protein
MGLLTWSSETPLASASLAPDTRPACVTLEVLIPETLYRRRVQEEAVLSLNASCR